MWKSFGSVSKLSSNLCHWSFGLVFFEIHFHQRRHEEDERYITGLKANLKKLCRSVISCWRDLTERRLSSHNILQSYTMSTLACTLINRSLSDLSDISLFNFRLQTNSHLFWTVWLICGRWRGCSAGSSCCWTWCKYYIFCLSTVHWLWILLT